MRPTPRGSKLWPRFGGWLRAKVGATTMSKRSSFPSTSTPKCTGQPGILPEQALRHWRREERSHPVTTNTTRRRSGAKSPGRANIPERNIPQPLMKLPDFKGHLRSPQDLRHRRALAGHYFPFAFSRRVKDRFSKSALTITDFTDRLSNFAM